MGDAVSAILAAMILRDFKSRFCVTPGRKLAAPLIEERLRREVLNDLVAKFEHQNEKQNPLAPGGRHKGDGGLCGRPHCMSDGMQPAAFYLTDVQTANEKLPQKIAQ
jgi:hypothetical protein